MLIRARATDGRAVSVMALAFVLFLGACAPAARVADLGECTLESGQRIDPCRVSYRLFGHLDAQASNVVLLVPWFRGTSHDMVPLIGPGKLVDSSRFFVIAVDPIGNGVSSSPSRTSSGALRRGFPSLSVHDLVEIERRLVIEVLGLSHLRAVVGISFGGMQAFEWAVSHPSLVERVVAIAATPRTAERDRARWSSEMRMFRAEPPWRRAAKALAAGRLLTAIREALADPDDYDVQAGAIIHHDVSRRFDGVMEDAARAVHARLLVVTAPADEVVDPEAALRFAEWCGAETLRLDGRCGHQAPSCEKAVLWPAVDRFLGTNP